MARRRWWLARNERAGGALVDDLGAGPVGVDTAVFIYFIEEDERFLPAIMPLFSAADAGNVELAQRYETALTRSRGVRMVDLTRDHFRLAAQVWAAIGTATPDALQLAASMAAGCSIFVTNDRCLPTMPGLRILQLGAYVG